MKEQVLTQLLQDHPIWITGMGAVSSAGHSVSDLYEAAKSGDQHRVWKTFPKDKNDHRFLTSPVPENSDIDEQLRSMRKLDRTAQFIWIAAHEALEQAQIDLDPKRTGVIMGSSRGPFFKYLETIEKIEHSKISPTLAASSTMASISGSLAQGLNLNGPSANYSAACASGAYAIANAAEKILLGQADTIIVGGSDACLHPAVLAPLKSAGVIGSHPDDQFACRPFDKDRNGFIPGEGAGCLILESSQSAISRGARPLALLKGWATGIDNAGRTGISEDGQQLWEIMDRSLQLADLTAEDIGAINAHGTGTRLNDLAESKAINLLERDRQRQIPCTSTKPITGHCLGATPLLEAILCIKSLEDQLILPTFACQNQDELCRVKLHKEQAAKAELKSIMSNSLGFWGYNASVIFGLD